MKFKQSSRYAVPSNEDFEPGSNEEVLKNHFSIQSKEVMEALEERELNRTESELLSLLTENQKGFNEYIVSIHAGVSMNYEPIKKIFKRLLEHSV